MIKNSGIGFALAKYNACV